MHTPYEGTDEAIPVRAETSLAPLDGPHADLSHVRSERSIVDAWIASVASPHSRAAYRADYDQFVAWCNEHRIDPVRFTRADANTYRDWLAGPQPGGRNGKYGRATIARKLTSISSFYGYVRDERPDVIPVNPFDKVDRPRPSRKSRTRHLTVDEADRFLDAAAEESPVAHALVDLMLSTGIRTTEAVTADVTDLYRDRDDLVLRVTRKGGEEDDVLVPPQTATTLYEYLDGRTSGPLFVWRHQTRRPTRQQIGYLVGKLARKAGLVVEQGDRLVSPHSLRHTAATQALNLPGNDVRKVQAMLGHADSRTTARYDGDATEAGRAAARSLGSLWHRDRRGGEAT
jgi:integrase/recombinase XerD